MLSQRLDQSADYGTYLQIKKVPDYRNSATFSNQRVSTEGKQFFTGTEKKLRDLPQAFQRRTYTRVEKYVPLKSVSQLLPPKCLTPTVYPKITPNERNMS